MRQQVLIISFLLHFVGVAFFTSCGGGTAAVNAEGGEEVSFEYARLLKVTKYDDYTVVSIANPWKEGHTLHTYVLVDSAGTVPDNVGEATVVRTPVRRSVVFTSPHTALLYDLQASQAVSGVCDLKYMLLPDVQRRAKGQLLLGEQPLVDCGSSMNPDVERIIDLKPQALVVSPFENSGGFGKLEQTDVPIIEAADYMEKTPLGRAEWMRFYGMIYGREHEADSLFAAVKARYTNLKRKAIKSHFSRSIIKERQTGAVWYMPGGDSYMARMFEDAGGSYAFASDEHAGSLALSFEQVLDKAGESDVWVFDYDRHPATLQELKAENAGYAQIKAFRTGEVYGCNLQVTPYFEEVSFHPDLLLADFIQLLHTDIQLGGLRYYHQLK